MYIWVGHLIPRSLLGTLEMWTNSKWIMIFSLVFYLQKDSLDDSGRWADGLTVWLVCWYCT